MELVVELTKQRGMSTILITMTSGWRRPIATGSLSWRKAALSKRDARAIFTSPELPHRN